MMTLKNTLNVDMSIRIMLGRVIAIIIAFHFSLTSCNAQSLREAFTAIPDSLMLYLSKNNRLDLMDFMDAKMKASVTNKLDGETVMTYLSDDSLALHMSDALTVEMKIHQADTIAVIDVKRTYNTISGQHQTLLTRYHARTWQELAPPIVVASTLPRFDEQVMSDNSQ